jgi:DNA primase
MSTIDEIKSRIDIVDLVSEAGVKLRHAGKNYTGFCPFHDNKKTPAFVVWPETGTWRCFGQCNEGGDIFKFVMKRENLDFKEVLNKLAARAGVEVPTYSKQSPEQKEAYENLRQLLEDAVVFYRGHLTANADVLNYLHEKRALTDASIETFGLGYAPKAVVLDDLVAVAGRRCLERFVIPLALTLLIGQLLPFGRHRLGGSRAGEQDGQGERGHQESHT